jgi:hypothetical protein
MKYIAYWFAKVEIYSGGLNLERSQSGFDPMDRLKIKQQICLGASG